MERIKPVITQDLVERLAGHRALAHVPREEMEWLAMHGCVRDLNTEDLLSVKGKQVNSLYIILSGHLALFVDRGAGPIKIMEWRGGDITGILPYSRMVAAPGNVMALEPAEILAVPGDLLGQMTRECSAVTTVLVHIMLDRARLFTSSELQNEKMMSLGKLSAGLAHELNNPASAIERCAAMLEDRLEDVECSARTLASAGLSEAQIAAIDAIRASCMEKPKHGPLSPMDRLDREETIAAWLVHHGLDTSNAEGLADTEVTLDALEQLAAAIEPSALNATLRWAAAGCAVKGLTSRIQDSAMCISSLVTAIKGFTHMDQANVAEPVDLATSLDHTVTVLKSKAREKSVVVCLRVEAGLPKARGFAGELNQVWGNLIDNALDAVGDGGRVEVIAFRESQAVVVKISDDGPGVRPEIRDRIFDPFFSTKPMGQGNGLGLDIVRRLVLHNNGVIEFESRPGQTDFQVKLPIATEA